MVNNFLILGRFLVEQFHLSIDVLLLEFISYEKKYYQGKTYPIINVYLNKKILKNSHQIKNNSKYKIIKF